MPYPERKLSMSFAVYYPALLGYHAALTACRFDGLGDIFLVEVPDNKLNDISFLWFINPDGDYLFGSCSRLRHLSVLPIHHLSPRNEQKPHEAQQNESYNPPITANRTGLILNSVAQGGEQARPKHKLYRSVGFHLADEIS